MGYPQIDHGPSAFAVGMLRFLKKNRDYNMQCGGEWRDVGKSSGGDKFDWLAYLEETWAIGSQFGAAARASFKKGGYYSFRPSASFSSSSKSRSTPTANAEDPRPIGRFLKTRRTESFPMLPSDPI